MRIRDRAPPLPRPYIALPRAASHRATWERQERGNPRNKICERYTYAPHLRTYTQHTQLFAAGEKHAAHDSLPALWTGLMSPVSMYPGEQFLTCLDFLAFGYISAFTDKGNKAGGVSTPLYSLRTSKAGTNHHLAHHLAHLEGRATHARPLLPAALAPVPYGFVLVRVRVRPLSRGFRASHGGGSVGRWK